MSRGHPAELSSTEEMFWRALMRLVLSLPRHLDGDLLEAADITVNEYVTLVSLSEAPGRELRMTDLARSAGLSASRMTRLVGDLQAEGMVTKRASAVDGRGFVTILTASGLNRLETAWGVYVASVRALVFDHLDPGSTSDVAQALREIAEGLERRNS